ncbi:MAG: molybdopterin-dependent oxidoreductase [Chloroflexi bacterium]|nr:molybdopterin-dependent oxidoreductase [Chloroflexota bacterium]
MVAGVCGICPGGCGVNVELVDGKIDRILPLAGHPVDIVCVRGAHAKEIVYSPDRLKYPLARAGARGEGRFERTTWDEALDRIASKLQEIKQSFGPEAALTYSGRGTFDVALVDSFSPPGVNIPGMLSPLFPFGSPNNAGCSSLCFVSYGMLAAVPTFGSDIRSTYADYGKSKLIVAWGANAATDSPPMAMRRTLSAKKRGARVIAIDHRRSEIAQKADEWMCIRPGTDGALALAMMNVIIGENLYDREFVEKWTVGFDELRQYVQAFPPEVGEAITWVPKERIVETAHAIATARHATLNMYTGLEYTNSGVQNIRAVFVLWAITGNLDVPGGLMFRPKVNSPFRRTDMDRPTQPKPIGYDKYPLYCDLTKSAHFMETDRAILEGDPYPVKALLINGASIITGYPDPERWKRCFEKLDLLVVMDRFMTADALYADFVLPATTGFENLAYQRYPSGWAQLRPRVIEPLAEARSDYTFYVELAKRLGYGDLFPQSEEELVQFAFEGSPVSVQQLADNPVGVRYSIGPMEYRKYEKGLLRKDRRPGFDTPSGKVEIASSLLAKYGYDPLPVYQEPREGPISTPELARTYPLVLNSGARLQSAFRSQHLNIPGLLKLQPEPQVIVHPGDAGPRGIADGDKVFVQTPRGKVRFTARVTDGIVQGAVEVNVGGGSPIHAPAWRESNTNYLTDFDNRDNISGFPVLKALLCEVRKAEG